jgi:hypothetical protein
VDTASEDAFAVFGTTANRHCEDNASPTSLLHSTTQMGDDACAAAPTEASNVVNSDRIAKLSNCV